jgi:hypothetical protein
LRVELLLYEGLFLFARPWNRRKLFFARARKDGQQKWSVVIDGRS